MDSSSEWLIKERKELLRVSQMLVYNKAYRQTLMFKQFPFVTTWRLLVSTRNSLHIRPSTLASFTKAFPNISKGRLFQQAADMSQVARRLHLDTMLAFTRSIPKASIQ
jgi:hypothetical protein